MLCRQGMQLALEFRHWCGGVVDNVYAKSIGGVNKALDSIKSSVNNDVLFVW